MENNFRIDSASISDRGLSNKRPNNEDSFLELNQKGVFAVADGVGGAQAGDVASQMAMEILGEAFNNLKPNEDAEELMKLAIEKANSAIYQMSHDLPQLATMATTIVALHLSGNIGTIGHVGDSRLYRLDEGGNLFRETLDHSVVEEEVRAGRMTVSQAANHPSRNIISRALGAENDVNVDLKTIMFEPSTTFLVCSDGITRHIDDFEIRELLMSNMKAAQICQKMKEICFERGAEDNLTAVIAKVSSVVEGNSHQVNTDANSTPELIEEPTVATAKPKSKSIIEFSDILDLGGEVQTAPLTMPPTSQLPPIELDVAHVPTSPSEIQAVTEPIYREEEDVSYTEPAENLPAPVAAKEAEKPYVPSVPVPKAVEVQTHIDREMDASNFFSKILMGFFSFLIGAIIGAGALYIYFQNNPAPIVPADPPYKTDDVSLASLENSRRLVDEDPVAYIAGIAQSPRDSEDYFLLGRAYMLTGKYGEAKTALIEAQSRLADASEGNDLVLANDIAAYLAIVESSISQKIFNDGVKKAKADAELENPETNSNLQNSNTSNN